MTEVELYEKTLLEMGNMLHPHLGDDNYTNRLLRKLFKNDSLCPREYFDLGKFYQRMLAFCNSENEERLSSLIWLKGLM